jgi:AcrR family transcriptional regulator
MKTATPQRQAQRSERSTRALLEAAADLIVEGGFSSMTLAAIGERAGYSRGLVTARFGSKAGLVEALIRRYVGRWNHENVLPRTEGESGLDGVVLLFDAIRVQAARDARGLRVLYTMIFEAVGPDEQLRSRFVVFHEAFRSDLARMLARGIEDGSVRDDVDPAAEAGLLVGSLRGLAYEWMLDQERFDLAGSLAYLISTTRTRLCAPVRQEQ